MIKAAQLKQAFYKEKEIEPWKSSKQKTEAKLH